MESVTIKDKEPLLSLLREYEEKLMILCHKISDIHGKIIIYQSLFLLSALIIIFLSLYFIKFSQITLFIFVISILFIIYILIVAWQEGKKLRVFRNEARRIRIRLEKIIRLGYQVQENMTFNTIAKIELDLRLADAESALEYYHVLVNQEQKLTDFDSFKTEVKNTP